MRNEKRPGAGASEALSHSDTREDSPPASLPPPAPRLERVWASTRFALTEFRIATYGGGAWPADRPSVLIDTLAKIWRRHLGRAERTFLAVAALEALDPEVREDVAFALDPWPYLSDAPFAERARERCVSGFLAMPATQRREFLARARVAA